jgi:hypothetical protein
MIQQAYTLTDCGDCLTVDEIVDQFSSKSDVLNISSIDCREVWLGLSV